MKVEGSISPIYWSFPVTPVEHSWIPLSLVRCSFPSSGSMLGTIRDIFALPVVGSSF